MYGPSIMKSDDVYQLKREVRTYLSGKIGSTIYSLRYTQLLPPNLDINEIVSRGVREEKQDTEVPNLTLLKIIDASYVDSDNVVVLKVELPIRAIRLIYGSLDHYNLKRDYKPTVFERMDISVVETPALRFSPKEINSIKKREIFRGMSRDALWASWGLEAKSKGLSNGGEQKVYRDTIMVDLKNNVVRDWLVLQ